MSFQKHLELSQMRDHFTLNYLFLSVDLPWMPVSSLFVHLASRKENTNAANTIVNGD